MISKITGGSASYLFEAIVLGKHKVKFFRCDKTGFIQTEAPYWLNEAYSEAITKLDIGLISRNQHLCQYCCSFIKKYFNTSGTFLDYAGGYGLFTRMMRDKNFNFYHYDPYCKNLFAEYFDLHRLNPVPKFELVTCFEVFEHLTDPLSEIEKILKYSDNLLFSTELQPDRLSEVDDWWYFSPETGQHVSFYNEDSLKCIAAQVGYNFYTDGKFLHLLTKKTFKRDPLKGSLIFNFIKERARFLKHFVFRNSEETLLEKDYKYIKSQLR